MSTQIGKIKPSRSQPGRHESETEPEIQTWDLEQEVLFWRRHAH